MKIGLAIPQLTPLATAAAVKPFILDAEATGFDSLWVQDHFMWPHEPERSHEVHLEGGLTLESYQMPDVYRSVMQPLELLAYAAALTSRVKLGTSILVSAYHRPLRLARQLATIDVLSDGRVICGLGLGAIREEFDQMDTPWANRGRRMDDFVHALRAGWDLDPVEYHGPFFDIPRCDSSPKPVQRTAAGRPTIPVLIGAGDAPQGQRRIAELGDGWIVTGIMHDADAIAAYAARLQQLAAAAGRDARIPIYRRAFLLPTLPGLEVPGGGLFGAAALRGSVDELVDEVASIAGSGVEHLVLDTNYWETCPSPDAWAGVVQQLAPLVEAAHAEV